MKVFAFVVFIIMFVFLLFYSSNFITEMYNQSNKSESVENVSYDEPDSTSNNDGNSSKEVQKVSNLTKENFYESINQDKLVLVDFYADWCGPCQMLSPIVDEVAGELTDVSFFRLDTDVEEDIALEYQIEYLPTLILFKNGERIDESIGLISKDELISFIASYSSQKSWHKPAKVI